MRSKSEQDQFDSKVLDFMQGKAPMTIGALAKSLSESPFDIRPSLLRLIKAGMVHEQRTPKSILYRAVAGGPEPGRKVA